METESTWRGEWRSREVGKCWACGATVYQAYGPGRRRRYCNNACRQLAYRKRKFARLRHTHWRVW